MPEQATSIPNLFLAGAHTRTTTDVWSIEAAVESGMRAAQAIDPRVRFIKNFKSPLLQLISMIDDLCYNAGLPHVLDFSLAAFLLLSVLAIVLSLIFHQ